MCCIDEWIPDTFMHYEWAPPLMEGLCYNTSKAIKCSIFTQNCHIQYKRITLPQLSHPQPHNIPLILFLSVFYQTVKPVKENFNYSEIKNWLQESTINYMYKDTGINGRHCTNISGRSRPVTLAVQTCPKLLMYSSWRFVLSLSLTPHTETYKV